MNEERIAYVEQLTEGLRALGYVPDRNIHLEIREAQGDVTALPTLASELVGLGAVIILAAASPEIQAAKGATQTVPIVMMNSADPVAQGFVASLNRLDGNVTGLTNVSRPIVLKRLELLKEVVGGLSRVAVIWNPSNPAKPIELADLVATASGLGIEIQSLEVRSASDFEPAFSAALRDRTQALLPLGDNLVSGQVAPIATFAIANRLPAIYESRAFAEAGGLMSLGANIGDQWRRGAAFVDRILRGAKAGELPVELPTTFEFTINLKSAQTLGIAIPQAVIAQATAVIQ